MPWTTNPALAPIMAQLQATSPADTSDSDAAYKQFMRGFLRKGRDVSGVDLFQPMLQAGQSQQRMATESAGYGDAGLRASTGSPEEKAVLDRQAEIGKERAREGTGMAIAQAVPGLIASGTQYGAEEAANQNAWNLGKFSTEADMTNQNSQWRQSPWWGVLQGIASGAGRAAAGFA
jgi:hypothetical protein